MNYRLEEKQHIHYESVEMYQLRTVFMFQSSSDRGAQRAGGSSSQSQTELAKDL